MRLSKDRMITDYICINNSAINTGGFDALQSIPNT